MIKRILTLSIILLMAIGGLSAEGRFVVKDGKFMLDGKSIQLICGELHYPRIPKEYWADRIRRAKAMGLNTVSAYVFWGFHETEPGVFNFSGQADVAEFVRTAQKEGMYVLLRPGPYVCAEWDFGGYPWWLMNEKDMKLRTKDPRFIELCKRYLKRLGEELAPLTINNGGNIIMVQVENEYGSYSNDKEYLALVRDAIKEVGFNVPLITCDGSGQMSAGYIEGALPTVNGATGEDIMKSIDRFHKGGPYFVAEFYPAWFDVWGFPHSEVQYQRPSEQMEWMLSHGVSISLYMFHGGTNFCYTNGANTNQGYYAPQPTSYDYDAPLGEWGNAYPKYHEFRRIIQKNLPEGETLPDVPADNPRIAVPAFELTQSAALASAFGKRISNDKPLTMEAAGQDLGYIHYETIITKPKSGKLIVRDLRDYAVVLLNGKQVGSLDRRYNQNSMELNIEQVPARLEIVVENVGRVNYGADIPNNHKGITDCVLFAGEEIKGWKTTPLPLYKQDVSKLSFGKPIKGVPAFHRGYFTLDSLGDTFLDMSKYSKGAVWVNGRSIGKFWEIGPQQTLYLPAPWLKKGRNEVVVFTYEDITGERTLAALDKPILNTLGMDRNKMDAPKRNVTGVPVLESGDVVLKGTCRESSDWQNFNLPQTTTMRHLAIEVLNCYENDKNVSLPEIEVIDASGKQVSKNRWSVVYVSSEKAQNNQGVAEKLFDEDIASHWRSNSQSETPQTHTIIVDMGEIINVKQIRIKTIDGAFVREKIKDFKIYGRPQFFLFK